MPADVADLYRLTDDGCPHGADDDAPAAELDAAIREIGRLLGW